MIETKMTKALTLQVSPDLALPLDAATQTFAFIARKRAGKTYAAGKLTELLLDAGVQVVVLDTVGNWYGLRIAADGKGKGFDIPVFGGLRGDLPIQATAGELIADVAVETARSMILDISQFSLGDRKRFATAFGERLWKNKKAQTHPTPLMLVLEEAQLIVPQFTGTSGGDAARMLGIYEEIIRLGGNYGIGVMMISQRPQSVNKEVLNQTECLFVLQVNGAQERKALKDWIVHQGMDPAILDELPSLPVGTAYVWSPQWLGILKKVRVGKKKTLDASATPRVGDTTVRRDPAPLDLGELEARMAQTIELAAANDPKQLKARVAELQNRVRVLEARPAPQPIVQAAEPVTEKVFVFREGEIETLRGAHAVEDKLVGDMRGALNHLDTFVTQVSVVSERMRQELATRMELAKLLREELARAEGLTNAPAKRTTVASSSAFRLPMPVAPNLRERAAAPNGNGAGVKLALGERRVLETLAHNPDGLSKTQLAVATGYSHRGGGFNNILGALRTAGRIAGNDPYQITEMGLESVGPVEQLPRGRALLEYWFARGGKARLGRAERLILESLWNVRPNGLTKEEIAERAGYAANGGGFGNALGKLRTLQLITRDSPHRLADAFLEG